MAKLEFNAENLERMAHVQTLIERAVLPFRENTEAAIVVFALIRVARFLLNLYPEKVRAELLEIISLYLKDEARVVEAPSSLRRFLLQ